MLTDSLPGLPNRAGFSDRLESRIEAGRVASCAVLVVDLDRFSRVNACLGALAGDELLITVARRIKGALRVRDTLARIGGDEFGILMAIDETPDRSDEHTSELQSLMRISYAVFCLKKKNTPRHGNNNKLT